MNDPILKLPVEEHLRSAVPAGDADRMWRSLKLRQQAEPARRQKRRRRRMAWASGSVVLAAAAAMAIFFGVRDVQGPLVLAGGHDLPSTLGTHEAPSVFDLDDGSRIVLAPATEARVAANDARELRTRLESGSAAFDVRPGGSRRWIIDAGDARVEVLGTRFTVTRRDGLVDVHVERGVVEVHHPSMSEPMRLTAGMSTTVGAGAQPAEPRAEAQLEPGVEGQVEGEVEGEVEPDPEAEPTELAAVDETGENQNELEASPADSEAVAVAPRPSTPGRNAWRGRARAGDFDAAYGLLGPRGLRARARRAGPNELLLLADVARRSGHPAEAMPLYSRLLERFPTNVRAPVAAFSLGRLQLDGAPGAAADSFAFVRAHRNGAALVEDATALEARASARAGRRARARRVAADYLARFPRGRRHEAMRRIAEDR